MAVDATLSRAGQSPVKTGTLPTQRSEVHEGTARRGRPPTRLEQERWAEGLSHLLMFVHDHGDALVPTGHVCDDGFKLGSWVRTQRAVQARGELRAERQAELTAAGFVWVALDRDALWLQGLAALTDYVRQLGDAKVPLWYRSPRDDFSLGRWVHNRRAEFWKGKLAPVQVAALDDLGFVWAARRRTGLSPRRQVGFDAAFEVWIGRLAAFRDSHGHVNVPSEYTDAQGAQLGHWVTRRRQEHRRGHLAPTRASRLEELGFTWSVRDNESQWAAGLCAAQAYREVHGHPNAPQSYVDADKFPLGQWLSTKRTTYRRGKLAAERVRSLDALGINWEPSKSR